MNLPGKQFTKSGVRKLECGCLVKFWGYQGIDYYQMCEQHEKRQQERVEKIRQLPFRQRFFHYLPYYFFLIMLVGGAAAFVMMLIDL